MTFDSSFQCAVVNSNLVAKMKNVEDLDSISGLTAIQWAKEISKLPGGCFTIAFFHCNRTDGIVSNKLTTVEGCTWRTQMPDDKICVDGDNLFLFNDANGNPKQCYRILVRYIAFPNDRFKLHKINWLDDEKPSTIR